jgi:hypothetical protein
VARTEKIWAAEGVRTEDVWRRVKMVTMLSALAGNQATWVPGMMTTSSVEVSEAPTGIKIRTKIRTRRAGRGLTKTTTRTRRRVGCSASSRKAKTTGQALAAKTKTIWLALAAGPGTVRGELEPDLETRLSPFAAFLTPVASLALR